MSEKEKKAYETIIMHLRAINKEMQKLNQDTKKIGYLFEDKVFLSEDDLRDYIGENIGEWFDNYTNDNMEDLINQKIEESEEIEIIG